ncbi:hypothetical protein [Demequina pelophila]|uniref:hypothetical protein n=1 Tax=Demequina pelophila TaxID=1638984 RepID=UPI0007822358|nr:hypothetical protein [Demequina pelophila]
MPHDQSGKRRTALKITLAGIAVVGIGAVATSAAWTDTVLFVADASAATFDLQGSADGGVSWEDANDDEASDTSGVVVIDVAEFEDLLPGEVRQFDVLLRNAGSTEITLATPGVTLVGDLFDGTLDLTASDADDPADVAVTDTDGVVLAAYDASTGVYAEYAATVTVTAPDWDRSYVGATGSFFLSFTGTAS